MQRSSGLLIAIGLLLELAHLRVKSGQAASDSNFLAMVEGKLANFDELTGPKLRVGILLLILGACLEAGLVDDLQEAVS